MKEVFVVSSRNGRGKNYFFNDLNSAVSFADKKHPNWAIYKAIDKSTEELEIFSVVECIR